MQGCQEVEEKTSAEKLSRALFSLIGCGDKNQNSGQTEAEWTWLTVCLDS